VLRNGSTFGIQCASTEIDFLRDVKLMLQTLGVDAKITLSHPAQQNTIKGVVYDCQALYRLLVTSYDLHVLLRMGFSTNRLDFTGATAPNRDARQFVEVVSVSRVDGVHDTFCFNELKRHRGIFNGILTGNCTEIMEYSSDSEWATCTLASIAVSMFASPGKPYDHQGLWKVAYFMCRALNKVIDVQKAPCKEAAAGSLRHRYIGIGLQGLADAFITMMLPFESDEAMALSTAIQETIYNGAVEASIDLAAKDGPYETYEGSPASKGLLQFDLVIKHSTHSSQIPCDMNLIAHNVFACLCF
jgi:ribonucleoside-diphosphate reductase alpha chain